MPDDSVIPPTHKKMEIEMVTVANVVHRLGEAWSCASAHNTDVVPGMETNVINDDGEFKSANYRNQETTS